MPNKDKRIDAYINQAQPFAKPILKKLRELIHKGIPEVEETMKWGMPFFEYKGPVCNFAGFKEHATFRFWKYQLMSDPGGKLNEIANKGGEAMGNLGRITGLENLPPDKIMIDFLKQARQINEEGLKVSVKKKAPKTGLKIPAYFTVALKKNKAAETAFKNFSYAHKKEYLQWITEAKTEPTRLKRLETAIEWMSEGKSRNWKYMKK
ncbi:MAG TPA: YdeI/OmpD-associated family protein [Ignavibacteriaceae bacterium]